MKENNKIVTQIPEFLENKNILLIGQSEAGKTRYVVEPSIVKSKDSMVILDLNGGIFKDTKETLEEKGYKIKILDLLHPKNSLCYNPFQYIKDEYDVISLTKFLIQYTAVENISEKDSFSPYFEEAEEALLIALINYLKTERPKEEQNFSMVLKMLSKSKLNLDIIFKKLEKKDPAHISVKKWKIFNVVGENIQKKVMISVAIRLSIFHARSIRRITCIDEMELEKLGDEKTALFLIISSKDNSINFLVNLLCSQALTALNYHIDESKRNRLKNHVHFILDDCIQIKGIFNFHESMYRLHRTGVHCTMTFQNMEQLKYLCSDSVSSFMCVFDVVMAFQDYEIWKNINSQLQD